MIDRYNYNITGKVIISFLSLSYQGMHFMHVKVISGDGEDKRLFFYLKIKFDTC